MAVNRQKIWQINFNKYNAVGGGLKCCHPLNYKNTTVNQSPPHVGERGNFYSRYGVQIQTPMVYGDDKVVVEVKIPEEIVNTFAIGPHLKGVATYLLKQCNGRYDNYLVGKRLLSYTEIAAPDTSENKFRMEDRLEAVSKFAKLLERSDEEAMDAISKILMIITEVTQNDITSI